MTQARGRSGPYFTEAARAKALEVRKAKASEPKSHAEVFITREPSLGRLFTWEIRQFGGIVLERSPEAFVDVEDAKRAGKAALAAKRAADGDSAWKCAGHDVPRGFTEEDNTCSSSSTRTMASVGTRTAAASI